MDEDEVYQSQFLLEVHAYDWIIKDSYGDNDHVTIHCWALDNESRPYLLRIHDFPAFCHIELPSIVRGHHHEWTRAEVELFYEYLCKYLGDHKPYHKTFSKARKTYYYRAGRRYPMLQVCFNTLKSMNICVSLLKNPIKTDGWGFIQCNVWENSVSIVRKLLTIRDVQYAQWFSIIGTKVNAEDRCSTLENEYIVQWDTMKAVDEDRCYSWISRPGVLAFDIECYSHKNRAMPDRYDVQDVAYMISCIFQRYLQPKTMKRFGIVIGECSHIPEDKLSNCTILQTSDELSMVHAFAKVILEVDPEVITGYNILSFDYPYLDHRVKRQLEKWPVMGRLLELPSHMTSKNWQSGAYGYQSINILHMEGRISIDLLPLVKRDHKLDKYDLNTVCRHFLNKSKHDISAQKMFKIYEDMCKARQEWALVSDQENIIQSAENPQSPEESLYKDIIADSSIAREEIKLLAEDHPDRISCQQRINKGEFYEFFLRRIDTYKFFKHARDEMTKVMEYCIQDSELVILLIEKLNTWVGLLELSSIMGVTIVELFTRGQQIRCMSQLYDLAAKEGYILDTRDASHVKYSGGFVFEPIPGLYENIICVDFSALYPSITQAYNICYTTLVPPEMDHIVPDEDCHVIEFDQEEALEPGMEAPIESVEPDDDATEKNEEPEEEEILQEIKIKKKKVLTIKRHYRFKWYKNQEGLVPKLVRLLVSKRRAVQAKMKGVKDPIIKNIMNARQLSLKISANSWSGFYGAGNGYMPLLEGAMCITATGRRLIGEVNDFCINKYGGRIIYNDTDSVRGHTPVLIRRPNGLMFYSQIKDIIEMYASSGQKEFYDIRHLQLDTWTEQGWTRINKIMRHKTTKQIYRILTHTGCVDVTEDHSLLDEQGASVRPGEVSVGSNLLHKDLPNIEYNDVDMDEEKAWVWGFFMAEGTCGAYNNENCNKYSWSISNQNMDFLYKCQQTMRRIEPDYDFIIDPCMESSNVDKLNARGDIVALVAKYNPLFYTKRSDTMRQNMGTDLGIRFKIVPPQILMGLSKYKKAFLEGFYAGDGSKTETNAENTRGRFDIKGQITAAGLFYISSCIGYKIGIDACKKAPTAKQTRDIPNIKEIDPEGYHREIYRCTLTKGKQRKATDKIKKIIPLGIMTEDVFDLETENHHFGAGIGRMIVHNSSMVDLNIKDRKDCNYWGVRLAQEISGVKKAVFDGEGKLIAGDMQPDGVSPHLMDVPGLFPPPLVVEFEKAMRILVFKKKKYASLLINKKGNFVKIPIRNSEGEIIGESDNYDILKRGIVLARRDNTRFLRDIYTEILNMILELKDFGQAFDILIDAVIKLLDNQIDPQHLICIRQLGSDYKSPSFFMKVFSDELKKAGKLVSPGDRLDFVIVRDESATLLGHKMKLYEQYTESLDSPTPYIIDHDYYLEKALMNPINQLFSVGFKKTIDKLSAVAYKAPRARKPIFLDEPMKLIIKMRQSGYHPTYLKRWVNHEINKIDNPAPIITLRIIKPEDIDNKPKQTIKLNVIRNGSSSSTPTPIASPSRINYVPPNLTNPITSPSRTNYIPPNSSYINPITSPNRIQSPRLIIPKIGMSNYVNK